MPLSVRRAAPLGSPTSRTRCTRPTARGARCDWGGPSVLSYMGLPHRASLANRRLRLRLTLEAVRGCDAVVALSQTPRPSTSSAGWACDPHVIAPRCRPRRRSRPARAARPRRPSCAPPIAREPRKRVGLLIDAVRQMDGVRLSSTAAGRARSSPSRSSSCATSTTAPRSPPPTARHGRGAARRWGEAFGLVLVESMACGTPSVGTHRGALRLAGGSAWPSTATTRAELAAGCSSALDGRGRTAAPAERAPSTSPRTPRGRLRAASTSWSAA